MKQKVITTIAVLLLALPAFGEEDEASEDKASAAFLRTACKQVVRSFDGETTPVDQYKDGYNEGFCFGMVATALTLARAFPKDYGRSFYGSQIPEGVNNIQAVRVFLKYADEHPERLHENGLQLLLVSWAHAWPGLPWPEAPKP